MAGAQPLNYTLQDPSQAFNQGVQQVAAVQQLRTAANAQEQQAALKTALGQLSANPTPANVAKISLQFPQLSEGFKRSFDMLDQSNRQTRLDQATQVYSALQAGDSDTAIDLLNNAATAYRNSGRESDAKAMETQAELIKLHPETASTSTGLFLASAMGPDKFAETFGKLGTERRAEEQAPEQLTKLQAEAKEAAVKAQFAESNAVRDLEKKGWDITKIQEDIKINRQNANIAALNAQISRESNALKKQELEVKLQELKDKRDESVRTKGADLESARGQIDNMLSTADRVLKTPIGVVQSATGPISSRLPTTSQAVADFEELITSLGSQSFLAQVPNLKGMGALSNAEGEKLQAALQSFSLRQSDKQLMENVREAQRLILKARANLGKRYGMPETVPDTPEAAPSPSDIDSLLRKYGPPAAVPNPALPAAASAGGPTPTGNPAVDSIPGR